MCCWADTTEVYYARMLAVFLCMQRGDVLLAVNDVSLINLTHNEAVQCLKASSSQSRRVIHVLQVGQPSTSAAVGTVNFRPMWTYWLSLPPYVITTHATKCGAGRI